MPTIRKRIIVTPSDPVWVAIDRLHVLTGKPKATLVADMLDAVSPIFVEQVEMMQKLAATPERARDLVQQFGVQGIQTISQQLLDLPPVPKKRGRPRKNAAP